MDWGNFTRNRRNFGAGMKIDGMRVIVGTILGFSVTIVIAVVFGFAIVICTWGLADRYVCEWLER